MLERKHVKTVVAGGIKYRPGAPDCRNCQTSCQSACKTSCTVGNLRCGKKEQG